jgi:AbrB family looped-hinge helix DNA binding protein
MPQAVVSTKFQVVIPKEIRRDINLKSGQILHIIAKGGVITMVPDQAIRRLRGYLKGMKASALREKNNRPYPRAGGVFRAHLRGRDRRS